MCKGTTNPRPTSEDNPTVHHPSETYKHPLWRSLKAADPHLLLVSYLFIHYCTISLFITELFVTYLRHIPYSYIYLRPCSDLHSFLFRSLLGQCLHYTLHFFLHVIILPSDPCQPDCLGHSCPYIRKESPLRAVSQTDQRIIVQFSVPSSGSSDSTCSWPQTLPSPP